MRYFRLSRVVAPFGVSGSFSSSFSETARALRTASICFCTCLRALVDALVGDLLVVEDHELADGALAGVQLVAELDDLLGDERRARDRLDDGELAALDAARDLDFALAREQRHGAHLAQVHADRIVGLVERARREVELELLGAFRRPVDRLDVVAQVFLVGVDDLDAGAAERVEEIVELVGRGDFRRQQLVDLVVEEVALLLADVDELPDFVVLLFDRQVRRAGATSVPRCDGVGLFSAAIKYQSHVRVEWRPAPEAGRFRAEWPPARVPTCSRLMRPDAIGGWGLGDVGGGDARDELGVHCT